MVVRIDASASWDLLSDYIAPPKVEAVQPYRERKLAHDRHWRSMDLGAGSGPGLSPANEKKPIDGFTPQETEYAEYKTLFQSNIKVEHNFPDVQELYGNLICTNYKLAFIPSENPALQPGNTNRYTLQMLTLPSVRDFFKVPLCLILSVEVRTYVKDDNKLKHSCVEVITKDGRKFNFVLKDFDQCMNAKKLIRIYTFLEKIDLENTLKDSFAHDYYKAIVGTEG